MKVFLYERVSSEEQVKHGYSLDAQDEALREFCERNNHVILGVYRDEGISGRKPYTKRPAMVQLLRDVETIKPQMILFTKLDRWFRNVKEYYRVQDVLDKYKVDWKAINEEYDTSTASGRLYVNIKLSIAQDEADRTSERIRDVQAHQVAQGKILGGKPPLGYSFKDKKLVQNEDVRIVRDAIDHYKMHQSINATTRHINDLYGLKFDHRSILTLFRNPILKGEYRGNLNFCDPILSEAEWDALQEIIPRNIKQATTRVYLFSGLIICPYCGRKLGGCADHRRKYYRCVQHYYSTCPMKHTVNEKKLEGWLLDNIEDDFKVNVTMKPREKKESPAKYKQRLKRLNDIYLLGNISEAEYKSKSAELQRIIADLSRIEPVKEDCFTAGWKDVYEMLDEEHRRSFWRNIIKAVRVDEDAQPIEVIY